MNNLLAIDIGNTRTKWRLHDGIIWQEQGALDTAQIKALESSLRNNIKFHILNKLYISSKDEKSTTASVIQQLAFTGAKVNLVQATKQQCGVTNHYATPEQLGSDRWCALIAARHLHQGSAVVVMAGTAMTVDALTAEGHFLGGIIVPGLSLMQDSLRNRTANLRPDTGAYRAFPSHTQDAMHSGIISASLGAIEKMRNTLVIAGHTDPICIISGGAASQLAPHLASPVMQIENLVLEGLLQIAKSESAGAK